MAEVAIITGSKNDLPLIKESKIAEVISNVLSRPGVIAVNVHVCSAHRNAAELEKLVAGPSGDADDAKVLIGVAGMAAALPGALAANTSMAKPVIAVPLDEHGIDSCLYMPPGVPVALAGVDKTGLKNAALLACQIVAAGEVDVARELRGYILETNKRPEINVDLSEVL